MRQNKIRWGISAGASMKKLLVLGKVLAAFFWGVVLANLLQPFAQPFALLLYIAGALALLIHGLELWVFNKQLAGARKPGQERAQVLLFGIFHLLTLPDLQAQSAEPGQEEPQLEVENA